MQGAPLRCALTLQLLNKQRANIASSLLWPWVDFVLIAVPWCALTEGCGAPGTVQGSVRCWCRAVAVLLQPASCILPESLSS